MTFAGELCEVERIGNMVDMHLCALQENREHVKPCCLVVEIVSGQVVLGHPGDLLLFSAGDSGGRGVEQGGAAGFHLGKNQGLMVSGDNVDLAELAAIVSVQNGIAAVDEKVDGQLFALGSEVSAPIRQILLPL